MSDVVAVVTDLFFQSRISAAARVAGRQVTFLTNNGAVADVSGAALALVDLDASLDVLGAVRSLSEAGAPVVAFGPHVDTDRRKAARSAGARRVLAKSKFVTDLPQLLGDTP